jgi:hypothetical protein
MSIWQWLGAAALLGMVNGALRTIARWMRGPLLGGPFPEGVDQGAILATRLSSLSDVSLIAMRQDTSLSDEARQAAVDALARRGSS